MPTIKTKKFILRPFRMSDAEELAVAINNKAIARNTLTIPYPYKLKDAKEWLNKKNKSEISFCIEIDGKVAGSIGFHNILRSNMADRAELGYWLSEKYWGKGIMTKAVKEVVKFGFEELKLKRIFAFTFSFNKVSMKVLQKNGFKLEGLLKKNVKKGEKFIDCYLFAKVK